MSLNSIDSIKTRSPLQVFAVFAIGIILPGAFLSYLGFRSIQYEGLLLHKQTEERYAALGDLMQKKAEEQLTNGVNALSVYARSEAFQHWTVAEMVPNVLSITKLNALPVQNAFVFDEQTRLVIPTLDSGAPGEAEKPHELNWGFLQNEIDALEHLEFVDKDVARAVEGYEALRSRVRQDDLQAALLKNIAGGYRKLHKNRQAESNYLELARTYDRVSDSSGYPMGFLARQLLVKLYDEEKAAERALEVRLDLLEGLVLNRWQIPISERQAFILGLKRSIQGSALPAASELNARWQRLQSLESRMAHAAPAAQTFAKDEAADLFKRLRQRGWMEQGGVLQLAGGSAGRRAAVVSPIYPPLKDHARGWLVAVVPGDTLLESLQQGLQEMAQPAGLTIALETAKEGSVPARPSSAFWKASLNRQAGGIDPPLRFQVFESRSGETEGLSRRRIWIYGGMVGLSFLVIIVGLVIMAQAVKRETEVANLKADFVANVSHELRTPLATISYIGERLSLGRYRSEGERKEFYGMLGEETTRLKDLIEDILDFSKMLAGKKVYGQEALDLSALARDAHERFLGKAQAKGFEVALHVPSEVVPIQGDRRALLQAFLNLLDNALKYSGTSRRIEVRVDINHEQASWSVRDFGVGIPPAEQEKIFEKFYRVERAMSRESEGGVGLGLAMVKHIVEGHKGRVRVESTLGVGSVFSLGFPLVKARHSSLVGSAKGEA